MGESKPVVVTSAANARIRHLLRMRDNRSRRKAGRVLVDGWRETERAIAAGLSLCQLCVADSPGDRELAAAIDPCCDKTTWVSPALLDRVAYGQSARQVVAEFQRPQCDLDRLTLSREPLVLVLDRIEKPGNVGAILRCADAIGADAVLLCESADPFNPNAIRNSLGSVFHVPMAEASAMEVGRRLKDAGIRALAARVESSQQLWETDLRGAVAIVLGSEADGLGNRWRTWPHLSAGNTESENLEIPGIRIPMLGRADSLNVSVCCAVIGYEATRQRRPT